METESREAMARFVKERPGASTRLVARAAGVDDSTADYHLRRLEKEGRLASERRGRELTWWSTACGYCPVLRGVIPVLRQESAAAVAARLSETPTPAAELARAAGVHPAGVRRLADSFEALGLVARSRRGLIALTEDAPLCLGMARAGERCDRWGKCAASRRVAATPRAGPPR